ncbi:MAG: ribbon-helix-helix protein, CopG family [Nocardioides sp.]|jgi:hypothetical protein
MPDVLIRDVPGEDLAALDEHAKKMGLTRSEYLRRRLHAEARRTTSSVTVQDFSTLAATIADLTDPDVMRDAWS